MNKMMKQLSLVALLIAGVMGGAQAAAISAVVTDTQDVVFGAPGAASIAITPVTGITAGNIPSDTKMANVTASASSGSLALRFAPGIMTLIKHASSGRGYNATATGKNTAAKMKVYIVENGANWYTGSVDTSKYFQQSVSSPDWYYTTRSATTGMLIALDGLQTIPADHYPVSLDAAVWME